MVRDCKKERIQMSASKDDAQQLHFIRRVACHHCGNIRKNQLKCVSCPQLYCKNCAQKMRFQHGANIFVDGCPVCKRMCCCAVKSSTCPRVHHCYRKCPVSKSGVDSNSSLVPTTHAESAKCSSLIPLDLLAAACDQSPTDEISQSNLVECKSENASSTESKQEPSVSLTGIVSSSSGDLNSLKHSFVATQAEQGDFQRPNLEDDRPLSASAMPLLIPLVNWQRYCQQSNLPTATNATRSSYFWNSSVESREQTEVKRARFTTEEEARVCSVIYLPTTQLSSSNSLAP